ncbi:MAG: YlxM family DNA-binding protein [Clostridia bacterium]|nr:YlxM family DNA-binding protein [Clostridia bacterium]
MLEKTDRINVLFDIYGSLLTDKQKELIMMYYFEDLSLAEIAEELGISRQAVFFGLKRSEELLEKYEDSLGLLKKLKSYEEQIGRVLGLLKDFRSTGERDKLDEAIVSLEEMSNFWQFIN